MNNILKSFKLVILSGCFIAGVLIFGACSSSKNGIKDPKEKEWINWKFEFKPGTSDENISRAKTLIEKNITEYLNKIDPDHKQFIVVNTSYKVDFSAPQRAITLSVIVRLEAAMLSIRVPRPSPPPPSMPFELGVFR